MCIREPKEDCTNPVDKSVGNQNFFAGFPLTEGCRRGLEVATGDKYRARALELLAQAETATDAEARARFENLAVAYLRLAMQAERNEGLVIDFELPSQQDKKSKA